MAGIEDRLLLLDGSAAATFVPGLDLEASERPGARADTSAAKPAVSAAVPTITHRRVRPTRSSAASRASAAREGFRPVFIRRSVPMVHPLSEEKISAQ
jgi:hypothetical protein